MKKWILVLLCLLFLFGSSSAEQEYRIGYINDNGNFLTDDQKTSLEDSIQIFRSKTKTDFVFLSLRDELGTVSNTGDFLEMYYLLNGFGIGPNRSCIVAFLYPNNRLLHVKCVPFGVYYASDEQVIIEFTNKATPFFSTGDFYSGISTLIDECSAAYDSYWANQLN